MVDILTLVTLILVVIIIAFLVAGTIIFVRQKKRIMSFVDEMVGGNPPPKPAAPTMSYGSRTAGTNATQSAVWKI